MTLTSGTNENGSTFYASTTGDGTGFKLTPSQNIDSTFVYYGESLVDKLKSYTSQILSISGALSQKENEFSKDLQNYDVELSELDTLSDTLEKRYKKQFTAMEAAISSLKNTGEFMTNLMDSLNKDN